MYDGVLPTQKDTYAFMEVTLMKLIQFVNFMESSLIDAEEMLNELILPTYSSFLRPTTW